MNDADLRSFPQCESDRPMTTPAANNLNSPAATARRLGAVTVVRQGRKGTSTGKARRAFTGTSRGSLLLSTPGQPSLIMLASALCLIISPNRVNASRLCQSRPVTGFIARRRYLLRVMAHTARTLIRPGGCPYCWYALFKEQRRGRYFPLSLSSRKRGWVNTLTPQIFQNIFSCPAGSGPCA